MIPFRPDKIDPPKFVEKEAEKQKISLVDDDQNGGGPGKKAKINCEEKDWRLKLPPIIGEDEGEKFSIIVNTGSAKELIDFNQVERELSLLNTGVKVEEDLYTI